jgi:hypothetical protein
MMSKKMKMKQKREGGHLHTPMPQVKCIYCDNCPAPKDPITCLSYGKLEDGQLYLFFWNLCEECFKEEQDDDDE